MSKNQLLYEKIVDYLKGQMLSGELKVDDKLPTELELAKQFEVSRITSKRALEELKSQGLIYRKRGSGSFVAQQNKINPVMYKPVTQVNTTTISNMIAIVLPIQNGDGSMMEVLAGATEFLNQYGYFLSIHNSEGNIEKEKDILNNLFEQQVSGIVLYPISDRENLTMMNKFHLSKYPIVTINKYYESVPISYVVSDNEQGAYNATKHLIELGHKQIGFISDGSIESATTIRNRYFGYCRSLVDGGLSIDESLIISIIDEKVSGELGESLLEQKYVKVLKSLMEKGMTGVICSNDYVASYVMKAVKTLDYRVPNDMSIVGFDNSEICQHMSTTLTSVEQNYKEMGEKAVELLIDSIMNTHKTKKSILATKLIHRESCFEIELDEED